MFVGLFLALNRPEVIVIAQLGSVVWYPATGLSIAFLLVMGPACGFLTALSVALSGILIYHEPLLSWSGTLGAIANGALFAGASYLLRGPLRIDLGLRLQRDVVRYVSVTTLASVLSALVGSACLVAGGSVSLRNFIDTTADWFRGDAISLLGVAPFLLIHGVPWARRRFLLQPQKTLREVDADSKKIAFTQMLEVGAQVVSGILVLSVTFGSAFGGFQASFLFFIPILWIAVRQGIRRVVTALLALNCGIVFALQHYVADPSLHDTISLLMMVVSATGLIVGAAVSERTRITRELSERTRQLILANQEMENEVAQRIQSEQRTLELLEREQLSTQHALEERALSEAVFQALPAMVCLFDAKHRVLRWNHSFETMLGYSTEEMQRLDALDIIADEDRPKIRKNLQLIFQLGAAQCEASLLTRMGQRISCYFSGARIYVSGSPCLLGAWLDVSPLKRAESELRSQTAFLEAQANSTIDGILVVDERGNVLLRNQRLLDMFKLPTDIAAGNVDRPMLQYVIPRMKDPESFRARVQYLYDHPRETSRDEIELNDGTVLDRYSAPVADTEGNYYGRIWTFRDITERRRNEEELRLLSIAVEQSPASIIITDPHGAITYVNRRFLQCTGYSADETLGSNPRILKSGYVPDQVYKDLWQTITSGGEWRGELCNKKKDGELFWEATTISPITNAKGAISHFLAIKEDITERRLIETQLRHAQKLEAVGQLAAGIAHEINTPTQFVTDNLTFLRDACQTTFELLECYRRTVHANSATPIPPPVRLELEQAERTADLEFLTRETPRAIEQALEGAARVAKIVRAMKEFSHPDSVDKAEADLNRAIETTITVARNEWKYCAEVETHLDEHLFPVPCHIGEINQVILNLVVNAAHAIKDKVGDGKKGRITVSTLARTDCAEISVSDTGTGIPDSARARVFDPFFTTKEVGKGTGQGLALAYTVVVKKHGGKIWFESEVGQGTTFFLQLPF
jgi:PAS domain S-box-containing protein